MAFTAIQFWRPPQVAERDRKGDRTRAQLFDAALVEFGRVGFEAASIGQIAARAGTSRANFYVYYPCKEAVLLELQWQMELELVQRIRPGRDLRETLALLLETLIELEARFEKSDLMRDMLGVYIRCPADLDLQAQPFPLRAELTQRFANARPGELRRGLDPTQASDLFLSSLFGLLIGLRGPLAGRRTEARQLADLFLQDPSDPPAAVAASKSPTATNRKGTPRRPQPRRV